MKKLSFVVAILLTSGCATVQTESLEMTTQAKEFKIPATDKAAIYIYRSDIPFGTALRKDIYINGECLGESATGVFFRTEVEGGAEHEIATESEFSPNKIMLFADIGKIYFIRQYIKPGLIVGGADIEQVDENIGKKQVMSLDMAKSGFCNSNYN